MKGNVKEEKDEARFEKYIEEVVYDFYDVATKDFLIGYQFRKIALQEREPEHPLLPPMEAFKDHLPRITTFWKNQLLGQKIPENTPPFDLINIHHDLKIRKGELGRWLVLFKEVLKDKTRQEQLPIGIINLNKQWLEKLSFFEKVFLKQLF